jgi:hypothetical protein
VSYEDRREQERQLIITDLTRLTGEGGGPDITDEEIEALLLAWEKTLTES